jgi:hypothetical protein
MALFGILAANMRGFNAPSLVYGNIKPLFHGTADMIAQGFIDIFIQGKFVTLFSFLFGLGFAVQLSRAEARGARFLSFYPRRLAALALFGLIHGLLIWWGDILLSYALGGALLLLFRKKSNKFALWWAGILFSVPVLTMTGFYIAALFGHTPKGMAYKPPDMVKIHSVIDIYAHGTVVERLHENLVVWKEELPAVGFGGYAAQKGLRGVPAAGTGGTGVRLRGGSASRAGFEADVLAFPGPRLIFSVRARDERRIRFRTGGVDPERRVEAQVHSVRGGGKDGAD